jgi:hypothetical protein
MKYLCLGFHDEQLWQTMPEGERTALMDETFAYADHLKRNGHILDDHALQSASTAATLRFERGKGKVSVTDGPFAETKEQLGGLMILEANDLNHAIQLMSKMPCMSMGGSIEIRPINEAIKFQTESSACRVAT